MFLGFNIGNTHTVLGLYAQNNPLPVYTYRYPTKREITVQELSDTIITALENYNPHATEQINGVIYSSVVPQCNQTYDTTSQNLFSISAHRITHLSRMPITIEYDNPAELGVDRIVNAVAAYKDYSTDCIIVDIGTAITFCLLEGSVLKGGLIAPGVAAAMKGLAQSAAQLYEVPFEKPPHIIAHNTKDALISGFFYGWVSLIEGIIQKIGATAHYTVILTGGMAEAIAPHLSFTVKIDTSLTMRGLYYLYNINR
ncbi:MAG: type III pantothenate kinase [Spirochaetes bacterium]|nr:type III pantothenate kinase [Spirochaetota bacterium]